ncbi:hypothetical protein [Gemmatimonas sp.]|uniref:hypothetical protein n=1 Tax=Gemmatimonas sp. TaxID=1962908 RepID=UPI00286DF0AB|nr:hypothetical protein [Gemmatimonas sp.]
MFTSSLRIAVLPLATVAAIAIPRVAAAQTCLGLADQRLVSQSVSGTAGASGELRRLSGQYSLAGERVFGSLTGSYLAREDRTAPGAVVGGELGYAKALPGGFAVCPRAQLTWQSARVGLDAFTTASLGAAFGRAISVTGSFALVPSLQLGIANRSGGPLGLLQIGPDTKLPPNNRTFGELGVGIGLRFGDVLTVRPAYNRAFGMGAGLLTDYDNTFSLSISVGRNRR